MRKLWLLLLALMFALSSAAPAAAAPAPADTASDGEPVRIVIDQIDMDRSILSVGLDAKRVPVVPKHDVGWYNLSAKPGAGENIVLWGHVLRFRDAPKLSAPFARVKELKKGAEIVLYTKDGTKHRYVVAKQLLVKPSEVKYILPMGQERLTLVSCAGSKVVVSGSVTNMTHRMITIALPAD